MRGATSLQGPHHTAQKSTSTGLSACGRSRWGREGRGWSEGACAGWRGRARCARARWGGRVRRRAAASEGCAVSWPGSRARRQRARGERRVHGCACMRDIAGGCALLTRAEQRRSRARRRRGPQWHSAQGAAATHLQYVLLPSRDALDFHHPGHMGGTRRNAGAEGGLGSKHSATGAECLHCGALSRGAGSNGGAFGRIGLCLNTAVLNAKAEGNPLCRLL